METELIRVGRASGSTGLGPLLIWGAQEVSGENH